MNTLNLGKKVCLFVLCLLIFESIASPHIAKAANVKNTQNFIAAYNLYTDDSESYYLTDDSGKIYLLIIERIPTNAKVANGSHKITCISPGAWEAGFSINISNNKITRVYSPFYRTITGSIRNTQLLLISSSKACYKFTYQIGVFPVSTGVQAVIDKNTLKATMI